MTDTEVKNEEKKPLEHKVGLHNYARKGELYDLFVIIGAPTVRKQRWVTLAHKWGGPIVSYPEAEFLARYWVPNPTEK